MICTSTSVVFHILFLVRRGHDCLVVGFTITYMQWKQVKSAANQIGPKSNRPQIKSAPSQIGPIFVVYYCQHAKLNSLNTIQQNI
jgi:hypothetical protein